VFGDIDGVVIFPREIEEEAVTLTLAKVRGEKSTREAIEKGMSAVEAEKTYGTF